MELVDSLKQSNNKISILKKIDIILSRKHLFEEVGEIIWKIFDCIDNIFDISLQYRIYLSSMVTKCVCTFYPKQILVEKRQVSIYAFLLSSIFQCLSNKRINNFKEAKAILDQINEYKIYDIFIPDSSSYELMTSLEKSVSSNSLLFISNIIISLANKYLPQDAPFWNCLIDSSVWKKCITLLPDCIQKSIHDFLFDWNGIVMENEENRLRNITSLINSGINNERTVLTILSRISDKSSSIRLAVGQYAGRILCAKFPDNIIKASYFVLQEALNDGEDAIRMGCIKTIKNNSPEIGSLIVQRCLDRNTEIRAIALKIILRDFINDFMIIHQILSIKEDNELVKSIHRDIYRRIFDSCQLDAMLNRIDNDLIINTIIGSQFKITLFDVYHIKSRALLKKIVFMCRDSINSYYSRCQEISFNDYFFLRYINSSNIRYNYYISELINHSKLIKPYQLQPVLTLAHLISRDTKIIYSIALTKSFHKMNNKIVSKCGINATFFKEYVELVDLNSEKEFKWAFRASFLSDIKKYYEFSKEFADKHINQFFMSLHFNPSNCCQIYTRSIVEIYNIVISLSSSSLMKLIHNIVQILEKPSSPIYLYGIVFMVYVYYSYLPSNQLSQEIKYAFESKIECRNELCIRINAKFDFYPEYSFEYVLKIINSLNIVHETIPSLFFLFFKNHQVFRYIIKNVDSSLKSYNSYDLFHKYFLMIS